MNTKSDKSAPDQWRSKAQPGEKAFHLGNKWRASPAFMADTARLFEAFGFTADEQRCDVDAVRPVRLRGARWGWAYRTVLAPARTLKRLLKPDP